MQDDTPWMPPSDDGSPPPPSLPTPATPPPPDAPSLPTPSTPPPPPAPPSAPSHWAPGGTPPPPAGSASPDLGQPPFAPAGPVVEPRPAERPRASKWLVGGAVAAVIAVGGAGVFAVSNLARSPQGGSGSADELGFDLMSSIENEDVLGVIDTLLPGERDAMRDPLIDVVAELTRLEVLSGDFDLSGLSGLDIEFEGESVEVRSTNVDDIVNVDLRADVTISLDGAALPIGALITDNLPEDELNELRGSRMTETDELDITLTAVDHDGRWFFSAFHSIAEAARAELAPGSLIPATGVGSDGADTPEAAFEQLLQRVEALDLTGLIRTLNPGEAAALQRYAPLFLDDAEAALDEVPLDWSITENSFRVEGSGDRRTVFLDSIAIEGTIDGGAFSVSTVGDCVSLEMDGESFEQCGDVASLEEFDDIFEDSPAVLHLLETINDAFADLEPIGLELQQFEGSWYVSPTATISEAFLKVLRALDRQEIDAIADAAEPAIEEVFDGLFDAINELPGVIQDPDSGDDVLTIDEFDDEFDDEFGDEFDDEFDDEWFRCYDELDAKAAAECFQSYVAAGDVDAMSTPIELRFPECGYADISWSGGLYQLSDEEFIAAATTAQPCFLDLVERGEISALELPSEITHLECFEGRNWYTVFDDPEYDERYYECISAPPGE